MSDNKEIMDYLGKISGQIVDMGENLKKEIDNVEKKLDEKIDNVEKKLDEKIDNVEKNLSEKFSEEIRMVEDALDHEINAVYLIACDNQKKIEKLQRDIDELLIPYNDRNAHANDEIAKIPKLDKRLNEAEKVIGDHSEAIRKLQEATA